MNVLVLTPSLYNTSQDHVTALSNGRVIWNAMVFGSLLCRSRMQNSIGSFTSVVITQKSGINVAGVCPAFSIASKDF